ncbi:DinB family protein [Sporosarcina sp. NCCP-2716]|uniref:DinB family protein n=1 Tax=Sporosarcina sp. NCCP-2716 TaxID=2943679 RepID=UPI00203C8517|nr:DinB family protein [Sporosarcina sp. NCCP-2716]
MIETFKKFLEDYSPEQLTLILEPDVWSVGQMYDHLLVVANEYLDNAEACAAACPWPSQGKTDFGEYLFAIGGFPPVKIQLPPELNAPPDNGKTKEELTLALNHLLSRMKKTGCAAEHISPDAKMEHGGFGWLNAQEWVELVGMHFHHHLRQKYELDQRLGVKP